MILSLGLDGFVPMLEDLVAAVAQALKIGTEIVKVSRLPKGVTVGNLRLIARESVTDNGSVKRVRTNATEQLGVATFPLSINPLAVYQHTRLAIRHQITQLPNSGR